MRQRFSPILQMLASTRLISLALFPLHELHNDVAEQITAPRALSEITMSTARIIFAAAIMLFAAYIVVMNWGCLIVSSRNKRRGIRYVHPFTFAAKDGRSVTTTGGWLPDFGSTHGTLLRTRFDPDWMDDVEEQTNYYSSGLNPQHYEPYRREVYIETLNDWGWFGAGAPPSWFTGHIYSHENLG